MTLAWKTTIPIRESFDYSALDPKIADEIRRATDSIKHRESSIGKEIIGIGVDLIAVKTKLGHGQFGRWLAAEFDWEERTARRFMSVAEAFKDKSASVSDLLPTTLYALAAPSTPAAIREEIVDRRGRGEYLADHVIKSMVTEAKRKVAQVEKRRVYRDGKKARTSPEFIRKQEQERQKNEREEAERKAALGRAATMIRERVGEELPQLLSLLDQIGPGGLWHLPEALKAIDGDGS